MLGGGRDDRPGIAQDDRSEPSGLAAARWALDDGVFFDRQVEAMPVVGAADHD
jgi:hypothetical protein